jgi:hypothetical protein
MLWLPCPVNTVVEKILESLFVGNQLSFQFAIIYVLDGYIIVDRDTGGRGGQVTKGTF